MGAVGSHRWRTRSRRATTRAPQLRKLYDGAQWRRWPLALKLGAHFNRPFRLLSDPFLRRRQIEQTGPDLHSSGIDGIRPSRRHAAGKFWPPGVNSTFC